MTTLYSTSADDIRAKRQQVPSESNGGTQVASRTHSHRLGENAFEEEDFSGLPPSR